MHGLNALAVVVLILSGWQIHSATAFLGFAIPKTIPLGGWLGGATQWHFAAMWVLGIDGLLYLAFDAVTGRLMRTFLPLSPKAFIVDLLAALKGLLAHTDPRQYNTVQRVAYLFVMVATVLLVVSGLVLWKSVQFLLLREWMVAVKARASSTFLPWLHSPLSWSCLW